jgi:hypothetical protein
MNPAITAETMRLSLDGIAIEVPREPPSPESCPVQSRIDCQDGLWSIEIRNGGRCVSSHGPETFTSALFRALMNDRLGAISPDAIVLRWTD